MSRQTVILQISVGSVIGRRPRLIAELRRWQRISLFAAELVGGLRLAKILSWRVLLRWVLLLRLVLSSWSHGDDFCFVQVRLESGILDGFSAV